MEIAEVVNKMRLNGLYRPHPVLFRMTARLLVEKKPRGSTAGNDTMEVASVKGRCMRMSATLATRATRVRKVPVLLATNRVVLSDLVLPFSAERFFSWASKALGKGVGCSSWLRLGAKASRRDPWHGLQNGVQGGE